MVLKNAKYTPQYPLRAPVMRAVIPAHQNSFSRLHQKTPGAELEEQEYDWAQQATNIEFLKPRSVNLADSDTVAPLQRKVQPSVSN